MQRDEIRDILKGIFEDETGKTLDHLHDDSIMAEEFDLDSVDMVSLIMQVESHFRIRMTYVELSEVENIGSLLDVIQSKVFATAAQQTRRAA